MLQESQNSKTEVSYTYGLDLISQNRDNKTTYYLYDGLGSARFLSNKSGKLTDSYNYEAFGKLLNKEGNTTNNYLFSGEQQDSETKQYYLRARYYAPNIGRFTQMDTYEGSIADPISLHKYLYANANPVNYTDPSGHYTMMDMSMAMDLKATLSNIQVDTYSYIQDALTSSWDGKSFSKTPDIAVTAVGVSLLMRFTPKLFKFFKAYKSPGYSTWSHIYNPKIVNSKIKGFHHAPMGIIPPKVEILGKFNKKHGFYEADIYMEPHFGASSRITPKLKEGTTMFPDEWSPAYVRKIVNKGYIKALLRGKGRDIQIPLNDILGNGYEGIYLQYYMKRANGRPFVHPVIK